jgi:hypothetical protein
MKLKNFQEYARHFESLSKKNMFEMHNFLGGNILVQSENNRGPGHRQKAAAWEMDGAAAQVSPSISTKLLLNFLGRQLLPHQMQLKTQFHLYQSAKARLPHFKLKSRDAH